jgi:hypothetical protein
MLQTLITKNMASIAAAEANHAIRIGMESCKSVSPYLYNISGGKSGAGPEKPVLARFCDAGENIRLAAGPVRD